MVQHSESATALAQDGEKYRLMGNYKAAAAKFEAAIGLAPNYTWAYAHLGASHRQHALSEAEKGNLGYAAELCAQADEQLKRAVELRPDYFWGLAQRGELYSLRGELFHIQDTTQALAYYQEALGYFSQAIEQNPFYAWAYAHRGYVYRMMELLKPQRRNRAYHAALADFVKATELDSSYAWAWAYRGIIRSFLKEYQQAFADTLVALTLDPTIFVDAKMRAGFTGVLLASSGNHTEAAACFEVALQQDPGNPQALYQRAVMLAQTPGVVARGEGATTPAQEAIKVAREVLTSAYEQTPRDLTPPALRPLTLAPAARAAYCLAGLHALEGNEQEALRYLAEALQKDPGGLTIEYMELDLAWQSLRDKEGFRTLVGA